MKDCELYSDGYCLHFKIKTRNYWGRSGLSGTQMTGKSCEGLCATGRCPKQTKKNR